MMQPNVVEFVHPVLSVSEKFEHKTLEMYLQRLRRSLNLDSRKQGCAIIRFDLRPLSVQVKIELCKLNARVWAAEWTDRVDMLSKSQEAGETVTRKLDARDLCHLLFFNRINSNVPNAACTLRVKRSERLETYAFQ